MTKGQEETVIIIHETVVQSWLRDLGTFLLVASLIGLGWLMGSNAMQWAGALMFFAISFVWATGGNRGTPQEAADKLRRDFGVVGKERP